MSDIKKKTEATEETVEIPVTDGSEEGDKNFGAYHHQFSTMRLRLSVCHIC